MKIGVTHYHPVHVALSPDGKTLATWGQNQERLEGSTLQLWDTSTGKERLQLKTEGFMIQHVVFPPDGKQMVTVEKGSILSIREVTTGKVVHQFVGCASTTVVAYSSDSKVLATGAASGWVQLWDPVLGRRLGQCKAPPRTLVTSIAFTRCNKVVAAGVAHEMIRIWDVPAGKERTPSLGHLAPVTELAFSRDGATLFSGGADGVRLHAISTGREISWIEPPEPFRSVNRSTLILSPNGGYIAWVDQHGREMTVVDNSSGEQIAAIRPARGKFVAAEFAPEGAAIAALEAEIKGRNQHLVAQVLDLETGKLRRKFRFSSAGNQWKLALSPRGSALVIAPTPLFGDQIKDPIAIRDMETGKKITRLTIHTADALMFSPDGRLLATTTSGKINLWDTANGRLMLTLEGAHDGGTVSLRFSPDGRLLAVVSQVPNSETDEIRLYELASGKVRVTFTGHRGGTLSLAFSLDGRTLASGGTDTTVMLWDVTGLTALALSRLHKPTSAELAALWAVLDKADAGEAHKAMARLTAWPIETIAIIRKELKPAPGTPLEENEVQRMIAELALSRSRFVRKRANGSERLGWLSARRWSRLWRERPTWRRRAVWRNCFALFDPSPRRK